MRSPADALRVAAPLGALAVAIFLLVPRGPAPAPGPAAPASPPPPAVPAPAKRDVLTLPASGPGSDLPPDLGRALQEELDRALAGKVGPRGDLRPEGPGRSFAEAAGDLGVVILTQLETEEKVVRLLDRGLLPERLPAPVRATLERYDRSLVEIGLPPTFEPFLAAAPAPVSSGSAIRPVRRHRDNATYRLLHDEVRTAPAMGWTRAAHLHLQAAYAERVRVHQILMEEGRIEDARNDNGDLLMQVKGGGGDHSEIAVKAMRDHPLGRDRLRDLLRVGTRETRLFLYCAARALDEDPDPAKEKRAAFFTDAYLGLRIFTMGAMVSASRIRLFAGTGRSPGCQYFQAETFRDLQIQRRRYLIPASWNPQEPVDLFQAALRSNVEAGFMKLAAEAWIRLLSQLLLFDRPREFREAVEAYRDRVLPHCDERQARKFRGFLEKLPRLEAEIGER